ncbi:hypothetical protein F4V44_02200 [Niallia endozanthoxylica]|uniref:Uncharacterized protein n=1 Tax=Niallia endozanthoxylica TaxID=2036016 RepID=A0A5J5I5G1_9BACI|nr:hypothetical protein F4V44_02200 [Niallia endozanthoxylica]
MQMHIMCYCIDHCHSRSF